MKATDMKKKPCPCGGTAVQVIAHIDAEGTLLPRPIRRGWYCAQCRSWEKAILREMKVEEQHMKAGGVE